MKKNPINWIYRIAAVLLVLVLITSHLSAGMVARYKVTASGGDGARVAKFEVVQSGELLVGGINVHMDPTTGTQLCADLTVVNKSETAIRCIPVVDTTDNLPITYVWSTDSTGKDSGKEVTQVEIAPNDSTPVQLYLFAVWSDEAAAKSFLYRREIDHVQVTLVCEQID